MVILHKYLSFVLILILLWIVVDGSTDSSIQIEEEKFRVELEQIFEALWDDAKTYIKQANILGPYMQDIKLIIQQYKKMKNDINSDLKIEKLTTLLNPLPLNIHNITNNVLYNHTLGNYAISSNLDNMIIKRFTNTTENKRKIQNGIVLSVIANMHYPSLFARYYGYVEDKNYLYVMIEYFLTDMYNFDFVSSLEEIQKDNRLYSLMATAAADKMQTKKDFTKALKNYHNSDCPKTREALKKLKMQFTSHSTALYNNTEKLWFRSKLSLEYQFDYFKISNFEDIEFKPKFEESLLNEEEIQMHKNFKDPYYIMEEMLHAIIMELPIYHYNTDCNAKFDQTELFSDFSGYKNNDPSDALSTDFEEKDYLKNFNCENERRTNNTFPATKSDQTEKKLFKKPNGQKKKNGNGANFYGSKYNKQKSPNHRKKFKEEKVLDIPKNYTTFKDEQILPCKYQKGFSVLLKFNNNMLHQTYNIFSYFAFIFLIYFPLHLFCKLLQYN